MNDMLYAPLLERKKERALNTKALAEMAGVSVVTIQKLENGDDISLASLRAICCALDYIPTVIDRSVVAQKELEATLAKIEEMKKMLEALETEKTALEDLINK